MVFSIRDSQLEHALADLDSRISPDVERDIQRQWVDFVDGRHDGQVFTPCRSRKAPSGFEWPAIGINEALDNPVAMALQQLAPCSQALANGSGQILSVRCNYGTSILPSVLGAPVHVMDDCFNTLPTATAVPDGIDGIKAVLDCGVPDLRSGQGGPVLDMAGVFMDIKARHPRVGEFVHVYHPDLQGPMDVCELMWGSALFLSLYDQSGLVHDMLRLIVETYKQFFRLWQDVVPPTGGYSTHWGMLIKGQIMLRDDSAMNLSPDMFDEFIRPYDSDLLAYLGGGGIHFCGRGDHYIGSASSIPGLSCINMSQPQYNDMEEIYRHTVDCGIVLNNFSRAAAEEALAAGRDLHGNVHCA